MALTERNWVIYTLSDPRAPESIRYVGVTHTSPKERLARHLSNAKKARYHSEKWIRSLLNESVLPRLTVIETGSGGSWEEAETKWIAWHRTQGHRLTNHAAGGRGPIGCARSLETKALLSAANKGKKQSPELVERRIAPLRGRSLSALAKAKISAGNKGKKRSPQILSALRVLRADPEWRARVSSSNKKTWAKKAQAKPSQTVVYQVSESTRQKMRVAHLGKRDTPETAARKKAAQKTVWAKRRAEGWTNRFAG